MATPAPDPIFLAQQLAAFHIFRGLPLAALQRIQARAPQLLPPGLVLFHQGDVIPWVYLVLDGEVELIRTENGRPVLRRLVGPGQVLGRLEVDQMEEQLGTARVRQPTRIIAVNLASLARLRSEYPELESRFDRSSVIGQLRANPYLAPLTDLEIKWISDILEIQEVEPGTRLHTRGVPAADILFIRQGRVRLEEESIMRWRSTGTVIGPQSVLQKIPSPIEAITESRGRIFRLPAEDFLQITQRHPHHDWLADPIPVDDVLDRVPLFQTLPMILRRRLAGYTMQIHFHRSHQFVTFAGRDAPYYYILVRGSALRQAITETGQVASLTIGPNAQFGKGALLWHDPAQETVETLEPTDWVRIHRDDFLLFLHHHPEAEAHLNLTPEERQRFQTTRKIELWQHADESILFKSRRHWIVLAKRLLALTPLVILHGLILLILALVLGHWPALGWQLLIAFLYLAPLAAWIIADYSNDFHVVTNKRVIHREKLLFIRDRTHSAPIEQVQNLDISRHLLGQLLGYGDLIISTAATKGQIIFDHLPHPNQAHHIITKKMQHIRVTIPVEDTKARRRELQKRLHLGLEEKIDDRALLEAPPRPERQRSSKLSFLRPLGIQESGGELRWRRHWFGLIRITLAPFFASLISLLVWVFLGILNVLNLATFPHIAMFFATLLLVGSSGFWLWWNWIDWMNDTYIVTDQLVERVIKKPLWFDEERTTLGLDRIQNVEAHRPNPLAYLLNYGNVEIKTAAQDGNTKFEYVPGPMDVQFIILNRSQNYQRTLERKRLEAQKKEMIAWLEAYHDLTQKKTQS